MRSFLANLLIPDAQPGDAYGWLCNQAGHAAVIGCTAAMLLLWAGLPPVAVPVAVALIYGLVWELAVQRSPWADGVTDTACVTCGAGVLAAALGQGLATAAAVQALWLVLLALGVWRRARLPAA